MTCNCNTDCCEDQPINAIQQAVNDAMADRFTELQGYVDSSKENADASAVSETNAAESATEAKGYRDQTEAIYQDAQALVPAILEASQNVEDAANAVNAAIDTASSITVRKYFYEIQGGESTIPVPEDLNARSVQYISIEGFQQWPGHGFNYDASTGIVTMDDAFDIEQAGRVAVLMLGTINADSSETLESTLASSQGASMVGTTDNITVQASLDSISTKLTTNDTKWETLASINGATLVGTSTGMTLQEILDLGYFLIADKTGATDVSAIVSAADAYSVANNIKINVPAGEYQIKNVTLKGHWEFWDEAYFISTLGERDNIVIADTGARLIAPKFKKTLSAWAIDGDYGNALRLGTYRQPTNGSDTHNIYVKDLYCLNVGTTYTSQSVEILGDVYNCTLNGAVIEGSGGGIICHWGGDVGDDGAHASQVSYSYHPHNIKLSNLVFRADSAGNAPGNTLIISSCYNMDIRNVSSYGVDRTIWIFPGDVYNEVAVTRDKYKVCTGINVNGLYINNPVDNNAAIDIGGIPATKRTANTTYYSRDRGPNASMDITVEGANIACADVVYANPNVIIRGAKNVKAQINKTGGERSSTYWAYLDYNDSCSLLLSGVSTAGERLRGNTNCDITLNGKRNSATAMSSSDSGCEIYSFTSGSQTFAAAAAGATTISVTPTDAGIIFNGAKILIGTTVVAEVTKSVLLTAGVANSVSVTPLSVSIAASATGVFVLPHTGTIIRGTKEGFLYNYRVANAWGLRFEVNSLNAYRGGMLLSGDYLYNVNVSKCLFQGTGQENSTPSRWDINLTASRIRTFVFRDNRLDPTQTNPVVNARISIASTDHSGVVIADNISTPTLSGVSYTLSNSTIASVGNLQQIYGNITGGENVTSLTTVEGRYEGLIFKGYARNSIAPTTGYFLAGSRLSKQTFAAGGYSELVCTASGSPGTWLNAGLVSA